MKSQELISVLSDPYLVSPNHRELIQLPWHSEMTVGAATSWAVEKMNLLGFTEFVITQNGHIVENQSQKVYPGDFLTVTVKHGFMAVVPMIATFFGISTFAAGLITAGIVLGGGLLLTSLLAPSVPSGDTSKPTYGWSGMTNETAPGNPVPVAYGQPYSAPQLVGSYRTVVGQGDMWQYLLLCASAGKTNNILSADDIIINDEPLTSWTQYTFGATDGSATITAATRTALADFQYIHHDRPFDKRLVHSDTSDPVLVSLMHLNVSPIADGSGRGAPNWTIGGSAQILTDTPKFGAGYLHLAADGDYIYTDDLEALRVDVNCEFEFAFRVPDLTDRMFWCECISGTTVMHTVQIQQVASCAYNSGDLVFQIHQGAGASVAAVAWWNEILSISETFTPTVNTWYFCRLQRYYDTTSASIKYQLLVESGGSYTVVGSATTPKHFISPDLSSIAFGETIQAYGDETATRKARYQQFIGKGYYVDSVAGTATLMYGRCDIDEFRVVRGLANDKTDRTLPTGELSTPAGTSDPFVIQTKSKVDSVRVIIEFTQGLFTQSDEGIESRSVTFKYDYRETGTLLWTTSIVTATAGTTSQYRVQYTLTFPSRALYDVRIERVTPDDGDSDSKNRSQSFLISLEEIIGLSLYYPGLQMVSIGLLATETRSGQIGTIKVHHNRTLIDIPNWNGTGTQSVDARVPAYQMVDALTNRFYGARVPITSLPETNWMEWHDWTEGVVETHKRAVSDMVFDEAGSLADTAITHIEQVGRARIMRIGADWLPLVDKPKTAQYLFSSGNIIKKSYQWESYEKSELSDAVEVQYYDAAKKGNRSSAIAKASWYETLTRQPKTATVEVRGITTHEQAMRQAIFQIQKNEFITRHGKLRSGLQSCLVECGDVFHIVPPTSKFVAGGRLAQDVEGDTIYLDQAVYFDEETYNGFLVLLAINADGEEESISITGPWDVSTYTLTFEGEYAGKRFDVYGLGRITEDRLLNQVVKKTINPKDQNVDIEFCEYSDSVFYHDDYDDGLVAI